MAKLTSQLSELILKRGKTDLINNASLLLSTVEHLTEVSNIRNRSPISAIFDLEVVHGARTFLQIFSYFFSLS